MSIILASTSIYRKQLLEKLQIPFECVAPDVDETPHKGETAADLALRLAVAKSQQVAERLGQGIIIGSDQVASLGENILGKPGTVENAIVQLQTCSGKQVRFFTGLCLTNAHTDQQVYMVEHYDVVFKTLTTRQIEKYVEKDLPLHCAGSFKCEGLGISLFKEMRGKDPNTLIGLPLMTLCDLLLEFNFDVLDN